VPRLYVVIPFWNCEALLERCLRSLEAQNAAAIAVLIDDASDPPARDLARRWCEQRDGRIYVALTKNEGPAAARHTGLRWVLEHAASEQDVIVLLDGDDELAHAQVLDTVSALYASDPRLKMSLGGHRRASGKAVYRRRYRRWHFALHMTQAVPWRGRHPRTFRVGLLRQVWPSIRWRWPDGNWIRTGTDVLLILPMLRAMRWHELSQPEEILYVYNDVRPDGTTLESSLRSRGLQIWTEAYVRRSLTWSFLALPRLALSAAHGRVNRLFRGRQEPTHG
jgi:glycosyltransferase involved in cell wall biosynthesis